MNIDKFRKITNIVNESIYLFVVFSIPLIFSPEEFFGFYQLPKESMLHFGANLLLVLLPIIFILNPHKFISNILNNRLILYAILLILFSYVISTLFSITILGSLWGREYGMSSYSLQTFFSFSVISINIITTNFDNSQIRRLFLTIFASSTLVAIIAILQNFLPSIFQTFTFYQQNRIVGTLGNPIYLGSFLLIGNLLSVIYFYGFSEISTKNKYNYYLFLLASTIQISAILLSLSSGPIISFLIGYMGIAISYYYLKNRSIKDFIILFLTPFLIGLIILSIPKYGVEEEYFDEKVERSGSLSKELELSIDIESGVNILSPNSFNYRGENWIGALKILQNWPTVLDNSNSNYWRAFVGYGPDTYVYLYPITVPIQEKIIISSHAHNLFFNILIENGIIGLASIIFLIWVSFKRLKYKFLSSNNSLKFIALSLGIIIISRLIEQMFGLAVINDLLYFYLLIVFISLITKEKLESKINLNFESILLRNGLILTISISIALSTILIIKDYNSTLSGFYFGKGISQINNGEIDKGIRNLDSARQLNKRSEYIQTELFKISYKVYNYENQRDSFRAGELLPAMYSTLIEHEALEPYAFNTQNFLTQVTWNMSLRKPEVFMEEAIGRYIRLRNLMPQYLNPQEILANVLVGVGELDLGKQEAELGIMMAESSDLWTPQSWWVLGEVEKINGNLNKAIEAFEKSVIHSQRKIDDYNSFENRAYAFLVLSHQSLALIYEFTDIEKAIFHIGEAQKHAYNSANVLLLEKRFQ